MKGEQELKSQSNYKDIFEDVFSQLGCFDGTFSLQVKPDSKLNQKPLRHVAYALQNPFREELEQLQQQDIIAPLGMDETTEWCNGFALVPKPNDKASLCLDPLRLSQALIQPDNRGPYSMIFSKC